MTPAAATSNSHSTPAAGVTRARCTDVVRVLHATGMDVAIAGDRCALMIYEPGGITRVLLTVDRFVEAARGATDCNGNPFPSPAGVRAALAQLEEDAAASRRQPPDAAAPAVITPRLAVEEKPLTAPAIEPIPERVGKSQRRKAVPRGTYQRAWARLLQDPSLTCAQAARAEGGVKGGFSVWMSHRGLSVRRLRAEHAARSPIAKPNGQLL